MFKFCQTSDCHNTNTAHNTSNHFPARSKAYSNFLTKPQILYSPTQLCFEQQSKGVALLSIHLFYLLLLHYNVKA